MIESATLQFLKDLAANNNREWFLANKHRHDVAKANVVDFAAAVIVELSKMDSRIVADVNPKSCVLRIYRDVRFSKNKTPYKNNFGINISGTVNSNIGYYIHIQPGNSFAGGGYWMPDGQHLKAIRQEIDYNGEILKNIIDQPDFKKTFGEFRLQEQLKTTPRDYKAEHADIDLLKLKSFASIQPFKDEQLMKPNLITDVISCLRKVYPLNAFLNNAIA
ncbi:MAG: DUF2461 domain-containing protein [Sphingobacteriaceae bacterium]